MADKTIADYQADYAAARAKGDAAGMKAANDGANAIRTANGQTAQYATGDINSVAKQTAAKQQTKPTNMPLSAKQAPAQPTQMRQPAGAGTPSTFDEMLLSEDNQNKIANASEKAMAALAAGDKETAQSWHNIAEAPRNEEGYSGGPDGSQYIPIYGADVVKNKKLSGVDTKSLNDRLSKWLETSQAQQNNSIDYATNQAITQLQRNQEDAQSGFDAQRKQIDLNEAQNLDNSALYAEARGDKGGIGQAQYNSIQNTAAINRQTVATQQTKLATDTARQIADLRAQGEFKKADAYLELTQTYLSKLMSLEQWAFEQNLSVEQFNMSMQQWYADFQQGVEEFNQQMDLSQRQFDWTKSNDVWNQNFQQNQFDYQKQQDAKAIAQAQVEAALSRGVMPSDALLNAAGMDKATAQGIVTRYLLEYNQKMAK